MITCHAMILGHHLWFGHADSHLICEDLTCQGNNEVHAFPILPVNLVRTRDGHRHRVTARFWTVGRLGLRRGPGAGLAVVLTLGDPGLTIDEPLDVRPGRTYVATLRAKGWRFFDRDVVDAVFRDNAEHPPLGRWLLGIASTLGEPFEVVVEGGPDPVGLYVLAGRLAPAVAFAVLVGLIVRTTGPPLGPRRRGRPPGSPWRRCRASSLTPTSGRSTRSCASSGPSLCSAPSAPWSTAGRSSRWPARESLWALALLTKIHAWFLIPIVAGLGLVRLGSAQGSRRR